MTGVSFLDFKKCFEDGHQVDIIYKDKYYQIFVGSDYIDYEIYSNNNEMPGKMFYGHKTFKPSVFTTFEEMVEEFFAFPFLEERTINEAEKDIYSPYNTKGY